MTGRPDNAFGALPIRERCGGCDQRPVAVASFPSDPTGMTLGWACDDHISALVGHVSEAGLDPDRHVFVITRTCLASGDDGVPCGAAGDFLVIQKGGKAIITVCRRHVDVWRPEPGDIEAD